MVWTYEVQPGTIPRDEVRFLIGDTDETDPQIQDEEIAYALSKTVDDAYKAAALCCRTIAARYARLSDSTIEEISVFNSQKYQHYLTLAIQIEQQRDSIIAGSLGVPYVGGVSVADYQTNDSNTDRTQPAFKPKMFTIPGGSDVILPNC